MVKWQELIEFLWCVSKINLSNKEEAFIFRFTKRNVPWESLGAFAVMQGIVGLLYYHLKHLELLDLLPKPFTKQIENAYHQIKKHAYTLEAEARVLSMNFKEAGIPVLALQGLSILNVYGDYGLRPLSDIDLMVHEDQKDRLKELLVEAGYRNFVTAYPDILHRGEISIDVHTHILNLDRIRNRRYLFPEDLTAMWERASPLAEESNGLMIPDPYDNFIALAAHALKHSYSRIIWLSDLHELLLKLSEYRNGLEELVTRAQYWHQEKIILYSLLLLEGIFDLKAPYWVKQDLGLKQLSILEKRLINLKLKGFLSKELCIPLWLCNIKGIGKKLKFINETIFPRNNIMDQIFLGNSEGYKRTVYLKRIFDALNLTIRNLYRALIFSIRPIIRR